MQKLLLEVVIELTPEPCNLHVNHIIQRGVAHHLLPYLPRKHFPRNDCAAVLQKVFEQVELPRCQLELFAASRSGVPFQFEGQICDLQRGEDGRELAQPAPLAPELFYGLTSPPRFALRAEGPILSWFDECGRPISSHELDCFTSAVVVEAEGMPVDKLFSALLKGQLIPQNTTV
jgi:hypothetical protein